MKIGAANAQVETQSQPAARTLQFNLRNAWLLELERAQLEGWNGVRLAPGPRLPELPHEDRPAATAAGGPASNATALERSGSGCAPPVDARPAPEGPFGAAEAELADRRDAERSASTAPRFRCDASEAHASGKPARESRSAAADPLFTPYPVPEAGLAPDRAGAADLRVAPAIDPVEKTPDAMPSADIPPFLPGRQWPARSVHMTVDRSGARVWIRDTHLAQGATGGILSSLSGELALRGLRLRMLTLNGRVAFDAGPAPGAERSGKTSDLHSTFYEEVNRHGND